MNASMTSGQVTQLRRFTEDAIKDALEVVNKNMTREGADEVIKRGNVLRKRILDVVIDTTKELSFVYAEQIQEWVSFYKKHFNLTLDLSGLQIPDHQAGFDRLIIVAKGLTRNQVYEACEKQFPCYRYRDDLDKAIKPDERDPKNGTYAIWVPDRVEADEENKNQSFDQRREQKCQDENILERMLHELKYFDETGKHLDIKNWTLTGSRDSDGDVVSAYWDGVEFYVYWDGSGDRRDGLRARSVVSPTAEQALPAQQS